MAKKLRQSRPRSQCCHANVITDGIPDFPDDKSVCTIYYVCLKCHQPCDIVLPKNRRSQARVTKHSEVVEINLNDDIDIRLTEKGVKVHKEYREKYHHDPLKKVYGRWMRIAFWEFVRIFSSKIHMGAPHIIVGGVIRIPNSHVKPAKQKAKKVFVHDDGTCIDGSRETPLVHGRCPICKIHPDMQSTAIIYQCPEHSVRLQDKKCPMCGTECDI